MKLLHHITYKFLVVAVVALALSGTALYFTLKELVEEEMAEQLELQADMIAMELREGRSVNFPLSKISRTTVSKPERIIKDTLLFDRLQNKYEDYLVLSLIKEINGSYYKIEVMTTFIGWQKYFSTIFYLLLLTMLVMAAVGLIFIYFLSRRIWQPFFHNLRLLRKYSLTDPDIALAASGISEFKEMEQALLSMTARSRREYLALREFTENASHEIQTPLSIVRAKLDRMAQLPVTEELANYIVQSRTEIDRLSRINKDLLLLVKLENNVFAGKAEISLDKELLRHIAQMEELFQNKNIELKISTDYPVSVLCNKELTDILISNLLTNALHYTPETGTVIVITTEKGFIIKNTGVPLTFPDTQIFDRFKKGGQINISNGLGLSIAHEICKLNRWSIYYKYESGWHIFEIFVAE